MRTTSQQTSRNLVELTDAEIDQVTGGIIIIGGTPDGNISVTGILGGPDTKESGFLSVEIGPVDLSIQPLSR